MNPVVHPVVGYLCYAAYARVRHGRPPDGAPAAVAIVAAAIPDLIDQPLWLLGVTPVGRTIAHSLFGAAVAVAVAVAVARLRGRPELGVAFAVGYLSHLAADVPWHVLAGDYDELGFLLWPVTHMPPYSGVKVLGEIGGVAVTTLWLEIVIFVVGVAVWVRDGKPGLGLVRR
ncbi:metal-dependent hydrolase [Halorubrum vacuolatum]|uniref:LexA-binding, inner membrane-associated putative hydrolase n=1 Tax=Halorubrum vacuolatum TaxID=63740 RepID=A0A238VD81_HALVU|nr:metal-dependent hydrolase [Halorubrum vacuolatum]SNR32161.1 LexA-binding, inner membrane-associated putative hydrolase [Halorubrum vacuolatum]